MTSLCPLNSFSAGKVLLSSGGTFLLPRCHLYGGVTNSNTPITIDGIHSVAVNGNDLGFDGYLDIGLYDTMEDLFVNFIGTVTFSVIGYFYIKHRGKGKLARAFIPTLSEQEEQDPAAPDSSQENSK